MEMEDQYGLSDLRQFITRATVAQFPPYPPQPTLPSSSDLFSAQQQPYEMVVLGRNMSVPTTVDMLHHHQQQHNNTTTTPTTIGVGFHHHKDHHHFNSDSTTTTATPTTNSGGFDGGDGGAARWPRQETLILLEVRSRLDHKFKEANQKGPLWDEVARIMCEEHGYQRTGKKCREKFENLYKYYKKTKEGKAGRQDGKHYRFFRQLEALYGDHTNNTPHHHHNNHHPTVSASEAGHHIAGNIPHFNNNNNNPHGSMPSFELCANENQILRPGSSVSLSTTSDFDTSSSDNEVGGSMESDESKKKKKSKRNWKVKIKEFIDHQMRKIMEKQEAWLDKMMTSFENREKERIQREETWRNHENERVEREHKFWANERAWIEARDSALMSALEKITNCRNHLPYCDHHHHNCRGDDNNSNNNIIINNNQWLEKEVTRLIQLRTSMESRFQQCGFSEEVLWEDIATKMAYLGYDRSASVCKEKWDNINKYFQEKDVSIRDESNKKRKEHYGEGDY